MVVGVGEGELVVGKIAEGNGNIITMGVGGLLTHWL